MAKKSNESSTKAVTEEVINRREQLRQQKLNAEKKKLLTAVYAVAGLIGLILVFAIVNEFIIAPGRTVSTVADENISLSEWKDQLIRGAEAAGLPIHTPVVKLTPEQQHLLWGGCDHLRESMLFSPM